MIKTAFIIKKLVSVPGILVDNGDMQYIEVCSQTFTSVTTQIWVVNSKHTCISPIYRMLVDKF